MRTCIAIVFIGLILSGTVSGLPLPRQNSATSTRDTFWEKFKTAVIRRDKAAVAELSQYPISMPYGMRSVRSKAQLIKRYREVFNHEGDAADCFKTAQPHSEAGKPREFSVGCKNGAGDEVVIYSFVLSRNGWRFNGLDNINE